MSSVDRKGTCWHTSCSLCSVCHFSQTCACVFECSGTSLSPLFWFLVFFAFLFFHGKVIWLQNLFWQVATLHQGWRLPAYQRCISCSDKALALVPTQQHPIINKSSRKEAFVTVYLDCFSSSPLISSSENWCTLRLKQWVWQVVVSVITAQISSAVALFPPPLCAIVGTFS